MQPVSAVVFAAGEGVRLRPLTQNRPKPMLPAATKPILEHVFDQLVDAGIEEIVVVVGYRRDRIQSYFGASHRGASITYVHQENQLGTGHALLAAESAIDGGCLAINGDQIVDSDLIRDVLAGHTADATATLAVVHRPNVGEYGGVIVDDGVVTRIVEHPPDDGTYLLNAGVYRLEPAVFEMVRSVEPLDGELLLVDALSALIESGAVIQGVSADGLWVDATYPWDLLDVSFELFDAGLVDGGRDPDEAAAIHEAAVIRAPVVVGRDAVVEAGAVVGPYTCLGENTTVGPNAVVERSVVDADSRIGAGATVVECVTGTGVRVGPGSTVPGGPSDVRVGDRVFEGESMGALLADRVHDEGGVAYVPGALVGSDVTLRAGTTVRGTIEAGTEVRS